MNFLAAALTSDSFALDDLHHQIEPLAVLRAMREAIDAGRTKRTNGIARDKAVAVDELLDGCLVCSVVARRSRGMVFIKRPVIQDSLVDGARRDEDESANSSTAGFLDQPQGA